MSGLSVTCTSHDYRFPKFSSNKTIPWMSILKRRRIPLLHLPFPPRSGLERVLCAQEVFPLPLCEQICHISFHSVLLLLLLLLLRQTAETSLLRFLPFILISFPSSSFLCSLYFWQGLKQQAREGVEDEVEGRGSDKAWNFAAKYRFPQKISAK